MNAIKLRTDFIALPVSIPSTILIALENISKVIPKLIIITLIFRNWKFSNPSNLVTTTAKTAITAAKAAIAPTADHNLAGSIFDNRYTEAAKIPIAIAKVCIESAMILNLFTFKDFENSFKTLVAP